MLEKNIFSKVPVNSDSEPSFSETKPTESMCGIFLIFAYTEIRWKFLIEMHGSVAKKNGHLDDRHLGNHHVFPLPRFSVRRWLFPQKKTPLNHPEGPDGDDRNSQFDWGPGETQCLRWRRVGGVDRGLQESGATNGNRG